MKIELDLSKKLHKEDLLFIYSLMRKRQQSANEIFEEVLISSVKHVLIKTLRDTYLNK